MHMTVSLGEPPQPIDQGTVPLHADLLPAKSKNWGCQSCRLYQYAGCFSKADREAYLATLDPDRRDKKNVSYQMEGQGSAKDGIMVILDMPSKSDDSEGSITSTAATYLIRKYAKAAGLDSKDWYFTYAVKCHDPDDRTNMASAVYCSGFLSDEIRRIKPKTILTFGIVALQLIIGRKDAMVSQFSAIPQNVTVAGHTCTCFPMQSPGYIQRNDYLVKKYMGEFDKLAEFLTGKTAVAVDLSQYGIITTVDDAITVCQRMIAATEKGKVIDADLETSGLNPYKVGARISILSLSCNVNKGYAIAYNHDDAPWTDEDRARFVKEGLKPLFRHPDVKLRWHNGKFDVKWCMRHFGFTPRDQWSDTMLVHYAVDENEEHGLKPLALRYTDMGDYDAELDDFLKRQGLPDSPRYDLVPLSLVGRYAAMDSVATRKLSVALQKEVERQDEFIALQANRIMPAVSAMTTRLEHNGCAIDLDYGRNFAKPYLVKAAEDSYAKILAEPIVRQFIRDREASARSEVLADREAKTAARVKEGKKPYPYKPLLPPDVKQYATPFSLNSPNQLKELIYGQKYYANEAVSFSDSGEPSTDKEALTALITKGSPIAKALMEYRLDEKLVTSYIEPILAKCDEQQDNFLHPSFLIHGTKTARFSCKDPNLMATPNKSGSVVKRLIVSRYGEQGCIVQADFSQLELRILAAASGDPKMIAAYTEGKDLHLVTTCLIFDMTEEQYHALPKDEQKKRRTVGKRCGFGIAYGIGAPGIQSTLASDGVVVTEDEARGYLDSFYEKYPAVAAWIEKVEGTTTDNAFSRSLFGRRRRLEQVRSNVSDVVARALRQGVNFAIQSSGADMTITSLLSMDREICARSGMDSRMYLPTLPRIDVPVDKRWRDVKIILQVHDSIVIDTPLCLAADVVDMFNRTMPKVVDIAGDIWGPEIYKYLKPMRKVVPECDVEVGLNYRDAYKVKTGADVEKAMFVSAAKKRAFDPAPTYKWSEADDTAALAAFASQKGNK